VTGYTLVVKVDSDDVPEDVVKEIVSTLEFEHRSAVRSVSVRDQDGKEPRGLQPQGEDDMTIKITANDTGNPPGQLASAELHFTEGPLEGMKLIGFSIWERRGGSGRNVTFPARSYVINGDRRAYALLRPIVDATAQERIRELVLKAFSEYEERANVEE
jgi:hypothetical protein